MTEKEPERLKNGDLPRYTNINTVTEKEIERRKRLTQ